MPQNQHVNTVASIIADYAYVARSRLRYWRYGPRPPAPLAASADSSGDARPPVLLIPGVFETWHYMKPIRDRLEALGFSVHCVAALGFNRHPIPEMAALLAEYVARDDLHNVVIVAHSKGGLIGKHMLVDAEVAGTSRLTRMITINTPFGGSPMARFGFGPWREFMPTRPVIVELADARDVNARISSLYSRYDQYVPHGNAVLAGAENAQLPHAGHFRVLALPDVIDEVVRRLGAGFAVG